MTHRLDPMDHLWSPWRAQHVASFSSAKAEADSSGRTLFQRLADEEQDEDNLILWRGTQVFVIMNLFPYNNGHIMVVPYRPVTSFDALSADEQLALTQTLDRCLRWLRAALAPDGFNIGINQGEAAGAGIPDHLHLHIVPRWTGDTNFMPVTARTKVIPEALADTYQKLRAVIDADPAV